MIILDRAQEFGWKATTNRKRELLTVTRYINLSIVGT